MATDTELQTYEKLFNERKESILENFKSYLRFPSVSADPIHDSDCTACAAWAAKYIEKIGLKVELLATATKPVVFAIFEGPIGSPVVLYYGHYDVQPTDPLSEWETKPFEPTLKGERVYARGALDNKGQTISFLEGVRTLIDRNLLKCTLKVVLEGEEESGSVGFGDSLAAWSDRLKADVLVICDTELVDPAIPEITMGLRGIAHLSVRLVGAKCDLHSGIHGGVAPNPAQQMAKLIATLHDDTGKVAIKSFYDDVKELTPEERKIVSTTDFDAAAYEREIGLPPIGGEKAFSALEKKGLRPTVEINGVHSGYGGPGHKTIVPAVAEAKISARLVRGQNPERVLECIKHHLRDHAPQGLKLEINDAAVGGAALSLDINSQIVARASIVLEKICGKKAILSWCGGSLPVIAELAALIKAEPLLVGFGGPEDHMHGPNESFSVTQIKRGFSFAAMMLEEIGKGA